MQRNMPVPIQLDSSIAIKISMGGSMFQERALMGRSDVWHKIKILKGTQYDKETILKAILAAIDPADLIPMKYQVSGEDTFFIARNCGPALDKLCKTNLIIKNPGGDPLILIVTLGFASIQDIKVNIQPLLITALKTRYDPNTKTLNLEEFQRDPDVSQVVYCPLTQNRTFNHVLKLTKNSFGPVEILKLQGNDLFNLSAMEHSSLSSLKYLDLRNNNLINIDALAPLRGLPINRLWLDGNPLCENYAKSAQYIESTKRYCPNLIQLDGVYLGQPGMPLTYTEYIDNESHRELINKFINHFFTIYDENDRTLLRGLYNPNAIYSLSFGIITTVAQKKKLGQFTASRNLLRTADPKKKCQHLHQGQDEVLAALKRLPRCYHDRNSFVYDLIYDDNKCLVFSVGGLVKTLTTNPQILSFSRTFILLAGIDNEYNIINDQYHVDSAGEEIPSDSIEMKTWSNDFVPTCFNVTEKKELTNKFKDITTLNDEWCRTYLEEAKWNIRKAVSNFMKDYKSSAIPREAFGI